MRRILLVLLAVSIFSTAMPLPSIAQPTTNDLAMLGHIGGTVDGVFVQGSYLYIGNHSELAILDIAKPGVPPRIGYVMLDGPIQDVFVLNQYAYVVGGGKLSVVDVSNPNAPTLMGIYTSPDGGRAYQVVVAGRYAYLTTGGSLRIVDVSNPAKPIGVGLYFPPGYTGIADITLSGNYLYIAVESRGMRIVSIANPTAPAEVGAYEAYVKLVEVEGHYAYVVGGPLQILDIANPSNPIKINEVFGGGTALEVAGGYAYVGGIHGFSVVDVRDPAASQIRGSVQWASVLELIVAGRYAYMANQFEGLGIVDIANPDAPVKIVGYVPPLGVKFGDVAIAGSYAYIAGGEWGLRVMNVSNPAFPREVGIYQPGTPVGAVLVAGGRAYLLTGKGIEAVDVTTPSKPKPLGTYVPPEHFQGYIAGESGRFLYVTVAGGLRIIDMINPAAPVQVGSYTPPNSFSFLAAQVIGRYAYLLEQRGTFPDTEEHFRILDISTPATPTLVGSYAPSGVSLLNAVVSGSYAYLITETAATLELQVVNIVNPAIPLEVGSVAISTTNLMIDGRFAYVGSSASLQAVDISNPAAPRMIGTYAPEDPVYSGDIVAANGYLYYSTDAQGFYILRFGHSLAGQITHANGRPAPFAGAAIKASTVPTTTTTASGTYALAQLPSGTYTLTPTLSGYRFWPVSRTLTIPASPGAADFTILPNPVAANSTPATSTSLSYTDTQGLRTSLAIPAGAVSQTTSLILTPTVAPAIAGWAFAGHAFDLLATQAGQPRPNLTFGTPITATIRYSVADVSLVSDLSQLTLQIWTGSTWQNAASTCSPASTYTHNLAQRLVSVAICRPGQLALRGPTYQNYLPISLYPGR